jgi:hypothetical protein
MVSDAVDIRGWVDDVSEILDHPLVVEAADNFSDREDRHDALRPLLVAVALVTIARERGFDVIVKDSQFRFPEWIRDR